MAVNYRNRNYVVYKGKTINIDDILDVMRMSKYCNDENSFSLLRVNDIRMLRNIAYDVNNGFKDFTDYNIHNYENYSYILDFDIKSLLMQHDGLEDINDFAGLKDSEYHMLLPKLLKYSDDNDLAYMMMQYFAPDNLSYVIYNDKKDKLSAISIQNQDLDFTNYDGVYYSLLNNGEQMLSNNPEMLSEFTDNVNILPANSIYEDGLVRKLKWK